MGWLLRRVQHYKKKWIETGKVDKEVAKRILRRSEVKYGNDGLNLFEVKQISFHAFTDAYLISRLFYG